MYGRFFLNRQRTTEDSNWPRNFSGSRATAPKSPVPRLRALFHSASVMKPSLLVSIQPKCSPNSLSALNSSCDTRPSWSLSYVVKADAKVGIIGSVLLKVETNRVLPIVTGVPNEPAVPTGIHHR